MHQPSSDQPLTPPSLRDAVSRQIEDLNANFPDEAPLVLAAINDRVLEPPSPPRENLSAHLPPADPEEKQAIFAKLKEVSASDSTQMSDQEVLYLEQQLADLLNFEVSLKLDGHQLAYSIGKIKALQEFKLSPSQQKNHLPFPESESQLKRPFFGWSNLAPSSTPNYSKFGIALPVLMNTSWSTQFHSLKKWYFHRKMLVINPIDSIFMVAEVLDIFHDPSHQYQFGGSPALIREGNFWSPQNLGKSIVLFITDEKSSISCGRVNI